MCGINTTVYPYRATWCAKLAWFLLRATLRNVLFFYHGLSYISGGLYSSDGLLSRFTLGGWPRYSPPKKALVSRSDASQRVWITTPTSVDNLLVHSGLHLIHIIA